MSTDTALTLFTSFREDIREFRELVISKSAKTTAAIDELKAAVTELKDRVTDLTETVNNFRANRDHFLEQDLEANMTEFPRARADANPFKDVEFSRDVSFPVNDNGSQKTPSWELFEILGKEIIGEAKWKVRYLNTFKKNARIYSDSLARRARCKLKLPSDATWSDVDPEDQYIIVDILEKGIGGEYPLKACVGQWGAKVLMVKAFFRTKGQGLVEPAKKSRSATNAPSVEAGSQASTTSASPADAESRPTGSSVQR
ncbi:hypothetical protein BJV82DRAFT_123744 [Fennellomyces sp. T-0311]|nr:hypothetical protein BJV82DRAFT_264746 [Fennellomyces sp. T-0311]KAI8149445.1 hypothetical protein BJV82DRAFT_123744 [Fennellomyces sp. T-0311]